MSGTAAAAAPKPAEAPAAPVGVELTAEGLQWMLLRATVSARGRDSDPTLSEAVQRGVACDVWLNAYDAAPEAVRQSWTHSAMATAAGSVWAPALAAVVNAAGYDWTAYCFETPRRAFVTTFLDAAAPLSDVERARLFRAMQRVGLYPSNGRALALELRSSASYAPRAFGLLISDPNADAALHGPTRCSAGDAHNPPRHHSVRSADDSLPLHDVLFAAAAPDPSVWRAFSDARLPFGARAMAEEWAYDRTGPCGCAGAQRISYNPLHNAICFAHDEAGEWLTARLPPKRLNERNRSTYDWTPLIAALRCTAPLTRTVAALLSRVPDVDLTLRVECDDKKERSAAELLSSRDAPEWLPPHLAAELKLKTEQFGAQYLPSCGAVR